MSVNSPNTSSFSLFKNTGFKTFHIGFWSLPISVVMTAFPSVILINVSFLSFFLLVKVCLPHLLKELTLVPLFFLYCINLIIFFLNLIISFCLLHLSLDCSWFSQNFDVTSLSYLFVVSEFLF